MTRRDGGEWITIQLGPEANCSGLQFWNSRYLSQNVSADSSLFRDTCDSTPVPRLVSFDWEPFSNNEASKYSISDSESFAWSGPLQKIRRSSGQRKNTSFPTCVCSLDSKSLIKTPVAVQTVQHFLQGVEIYKEKLGEEFLEHVRRELEFCDRLGGFQLIVDSFSGLGGFASELGYGLKDEFHSKVPCVLFGCGDSRVEHLSSKAFNEAKLLVSLLDNNIRYIPLHSWKVHTTDPTKDIWQDWAPDLGECSVHGRNCRLTAVAMDCFYTLLMSPTDIATRNMALEEIFQGNRYTTMNWISLLPLVSNKNSEEKWKLKTLITQGFCERKTPPLYTIDWISRRYASKEEKVTSNDADLAIWIIRGTSWDNSKTVHSSSSPINMRDMLLDAIERREPIILTEPFGYRRVVDGNPNEVECCSLPFHEACPLEHIGELSSNCVWNGQYYDMAIDQLKKYKNRQYSEEINLDDEIERMTYAKENLQFL